MLTRDGRALLVTAVVAAGAGRIFGIPELLVVGAATGVLLVVVAGLVHGRRLRLEVTRQVHPTRVHVGTDSTIELSATNRAGRRSPPLRLHDRVSETRGATLMVAPLGPGRSASAGYALPTHRRGIHRIGPLDVVLTDPFGLVEARTRAATVDELTVLPAVDLVQPPPLAPGEEPHRASQPSRTLAPSGADLHSLRPYVVGDDLRRVHWRSTARHGDLLVRVDEQPWQGRTTVLLDARHATAPAALELAVSAAASVLVASRQRGDGVRLVRAGRRTVPPMARGNAESDALLEQLAALEPDADQPLGLTVRALASDQVGGTLVVITALASPSELHELVRLRPRYGTIVVVVLQPSSWGSDQAPQGSSTPWARLVEVSDARPFPVAWDLAVRGTRA